VGPGLRASRYNWQVRVDSRNSVLYNTRSGAIARVPSDFDIETVSVGREQEILERNGFAVPDDLSEIDLIRHDSSRSNWGGHNLVLHIYPTLACNLSCAYCYQRSPTHDPEL